MKMIHLFSELQINISMHHCKMSNPVNFFNKARFRPMALKVTAQNDPFSPFSLFPKFKLFRNLLKWLRGLQTSFCSIQEMSHLTGCVFGVPPQKFAISPVIKLPSLQYKHFTSAQKIKQTFFLFCTTSVL